MSEELIENKINKLTLNEKPSRRFKFSPDLKEYLIKSKISSDENKYKLTRAYIEIINNFENNNSI